MFRQIEYSTALYLMLKVICLSCQIEFGSSSPLLVSFPRGPQVGAVPAVREKVRGHTGSVSLWRLLLQLNPGGIRGIIGSKEARALCATWIPSFDSPSATDASRDLGGFATARRKAQLPVIFQLPACCGRILLCVGMDSLISCFVYTSALTVTRERLLLLKQSHDSWRDAGHGRAPLCHWSAGQWGVPLTWGSPLEVSSPTKSMQPSPSGKIVKDLRLAQINWIRTIF